MSIQYYLEQPYNEGGSAEERKQIQDHIKGLKDKNKPIPERYLNPKETAVYLMIRGKDHPPIKINTKVKLLPKYWNNKADDPVRSTYLKSNSLNAKLRKWKADVQAVMVDYHEQGGRISMEELKRKINGCLFSSGGGKASPDRPALDVIFDWIMKGDPNLGIVPNPKGVGGRSLQMYKLTQDHLVTFRTKYGHSLQLVDINYSWWLKFKDYLIGTGNYYNQSANNILKKVKAVLNHTIINFSQEVGGPIEEELCQKLAANVKRFKMFETAKKDRESLTLEELDFIWSLDLSQEPRLERARDLIVFKGWTGPRISNLKELMPYQADLDAGEIRYKAIKTKDQKDTIVPLNTIAKTIIKKYQGKQETLLPVISGQKLNDYLQEILTICASFHETVKNAVSTQDYELALMSWPDSTRFAGWVGMQADSIDAVQWAGIRQICSGLNREVEIKERRGSRLEKSVLKRYTLLSVHTLRHYFGTFLINQGTSLEDVGALMAITPHTARTYAHTDNRKAAEKAKLVLERSPFTG